MRESFGGAFMIKLAIVFLIIYVSFMAVAVNYAKAFRVKNQIINILEQHQYRSGDDDTVTAVGIYLGTVSYQVGDISCSNSSDPFKLYGVCVDAHDDNNNNKVYYTVTTFIAIDFPFFNLKMTLPIRGETKTIIY